MSSLNCQPPNQPPAKFSTYKVGIIFLGKISIPLALVLVILHPLQSSQSVGVLSHLNDAACLTGQVSHDQLTCACWLLPTGLQSPLLSLSSFLSFPSSPLCTDSLSEDSTTSIALAAPFECTVCRKNIICALWVMYPFKVVYIYAWQSMNYHLPLKRQASLLLLLPLLPLLSLPLVLCFMFYIT